MNFKINTVADRIRSGLIEPEKLCNMRDFAKSEDMILHSIPLKDGSALKLLANAVEFDCLIMRNGKVITARGRAGTADDVAADICGFFNRLTRRRSELENENVDTESFIMINNYLNKYDKFMTEV
jgi:hypothetical protein